MRKIIAVFICIMIMLLACSCGNMAVFDLGNYDFNKVHVDSYHYSGCFTVEKWHNDSTGVEVKTREVGSIFVCEGNYFLVEDVCPFCVGDSNV